MANLFQFALAAASNAAADLAANAPNPHVSVVVVTGFGLVLCVLFVLILVLSLEGKIFSSIDAKKANKKDVVKKTEKSVKSATNVTSAAPVIENGVPPEVVAAIMAAISCMENGRFELRSITRAKGSRSAWNMAGTVSYTEPF